VELGPQGERCFENLFPFTLHETDTLELPQVSLKKIAVNNFAPPLIDSFIIIVSTETKLNIKVDYIFHSTY
jgi:hypothetical protein